MAWQLLADSLNCQAVQCFCANGGTYEILLRPQTHSSAELGLKHTTLNLYRIAYTKLPNLNSLRFLKSHETYFVTADFMGEVKILLLSSFSGLLWGFCPSHLKFRQVSAMSEINFSKKLFAVTGEKSSQEDQTS